MTTFYRMIPSAPPVDPGSRDAQGHLPTRAAAHCAAATLASRWGHYLYPPMAFSAVWHGGKILWKYGDLPDWLHLQSACQFPGYAATFDRIAPWHLRGFSPPFLSALPEAGLLQIWTGYFARTEPGVSLWIGAPSNRPPHGDYMMFDGIVAADKGQAFSPVFANVRLFEDRVVHFTMPRPLIQVRPLPHAAYGRAANQCEQVADLAADEWDSYAAYLARKKKAAA